MTFLASGSLVLFGGSGAGSGWDSESTGGRRLTDQMADLPSDLDFLH